jgi:hypothetical protein
MMNHSFNVEDAEIAAEARIKMPAFFGVGPNPNNLAMSFSCLRSPRPLR